MIYNIVYKELQFEKESDDDSIRMINRCATINKWKKGINGLHRIVSITSLDNAVEIWYEVV